MLFLLALACKHPADDVETGAVDTDDTTPPVLSEDDLAAIAAAVDTDLGASLASGCQIAVWKDGAIVYTAEFGKADPTDLVKLVTADMLFQIGSDTKKLTALALLQQEQAGTLARTDTVADAIPGLTLAASPEWAEAATLHDLISHQGGLYDDTPWDDNPADTYLHDRAFGTFAENEWQMAPPGAMWNYSNANFSVAGLAVETAAGKPYADVLEQDIFAPLGMTRTFARKAEVVADGNYAIGKGYTGSSADPYDPFFGASNYVEGRAAMEDVADNAFTRPAGLVWSTASDMASYGGFLIDGNPDVIDAERLAALSTPQVRMYPALDAQQYGYGLMIYDGVTLFDGYHDMRVWSHGGNTLSFTSTTWMLPDQHVSISILSNGYGDDFTPTAVELMMRLGDLPPVTDAPPLPSAETAHAALVGTYVDPYIGEMIITDNDGELRIFIPGLVDAGLSANGAKLTLALTDVYTFRFGGSTYDVTFVADDAGTYTWIRNRTVVGTRQTAFTKHAAPTRTRTREEQLIALAEMRAAQRFTPWATR